MKELRQIIAYLMLGLFACSQVVSPLLNVVLRFHQKTQDIHRECTRETATLHFSASEWSEVKKIRPNEIDVNGRRFDIHNIQHLDHEVYLSGHFDSKEDELLKLCKEAKKKNTTTQENGLSFCPLFFQEVIPLNFFRDPFLINRYFHQGDPEVISTIEIPSPPPKPKESMRA